VRGAQSKSASGDREHHPRDVLDGQKLRGKGTAPPAAVPDAPPAPPGVRARARALRGLIRRAAAPPLVLRDEYLDWLLLVNAGTQVAGNLRLIDLAIAAAPPAPMLEIGAFCGLSTSIIQYLKRKHGRREPLFTCEKWTFAGSEKRLPPGAPVTRGQLREFVIESFDRSVQTFSAEELPLTIEASPDEFFALWRERGRVRERFGREVSLGGPLGFVFIDGSHRAEYAIRDFINCDRHLLDGGLLLFEDSDDADDSEVRSVIRHVKRSGRYEVVAKHPSCVVRKLR
jgi:Methyltransferase domain